MENTTKPAVKTVSCRFCGGTLSPRAKVCPHCGDPINHGNGAKITVTASSDGSVYLHRRYGDEIHSELLGRVHYTGPPYINHQELRLGDYVCMGVKLGYLEFREWRSAK